MNAIKTPHITKLKSFTALIKSWCFDMEVKKVILLFSISLACSFCQEAIEDIELKEKPESKNDISVKQDRSGGVDGRCSSCPNTRVIPVPAYLQQGVGQIDGAPLYGYINNDLVPVPAPNSLKQVAPVRILNNQRHVLYANSKIRPVEDGRDSPLFPLKDHYKNHPSIATINPFNIHNVEDVPSGVSVHQLSQDVSDESEEQALLNILQQSGNHNSGNEDSQQLLMGSNGAYLRSLVPHRDMHSLSQIDPMVDCVSDICKVCVYCLRNDCSEYLSSVQNYASPLPPYLENIEIGVNDLGELIYSPQNGGTLPVGDLQNQYKSGNRRHNVINVRDIVTNQVVGGGAGDVEGPSAVSIVVKESHGRSNPYVQRLPSSSNFRHSVPQVDERRSKNMDTADIIKKFAVLPSQIIRDSSKNLLSIIPGFDNFRRSNQRSGEKIDASENTGAAVRGQANGDDLGIRIVGGNHATSSGTPVQIKARLGD